jgi:hypothetical protein
MTRGGEREYDERGRVTIQIILTVVGLANDDVTTGVYENILTIIVGPASSFVDLAIQIVHTLMKASMKGCLWLYAFDVLPP